MIRLLHLSDIHFGAVDERLVEPMLDLAHRLRPDATVISGDLTQRARPEQFAAARAFIDRLPGPVLCVPGNHDMPLYNLVLRLAAPFARYRRAMGPELEPTLTLPGAVLQGVNTANPLVWKSGVLRPSSTERLERTFASAPPGTMRIAVLHHAPVPAADGTPADMADPSAVRTALMQAGADIVLSGHTHMPHTGIAETSAGVLFLQVGTAISSRLKTGTNDLALITLGDSELTVESWLSPPKAAGFEAGPTTRYGRTLAAWQKLTDS
ncbi:MAG: metallophosphoesterase [Rhodobacterales bacterium]|nr:metallophosphoesterase [Rhodobacterales bacterium]